VAGLVTSFGSGAMTNSIEELRHAECIFAIGTNTTSAHPVLALNIKEAARRGATLIVANPKEIDLVEHASLFIRHKPGTDVVLLMGMMRVIVDEGLQDEQFIADRCENFEEFKESLAKFDMDFVEETTGVPREKIMEAARAYATKKPSSLCYAMGITQHTHGTDNVMATANLAMLTGNIGKPSTGVNPLRGQNNVQGACDMGALPNNYPGYQKVVDPEVKKKFETAWGCELNGEIGLTLTEVFHSMSDGKVTAFYMVGENPVLADADASHVEDGLQKVEFLVCQDIFLTESAKFADVVLPAASFAEKEGTNTNTERRIQRVRRVIEPVGDSKPDWWIVCELAKRMGAPGFDFTDPREIMGEIASVTPQYGGITYERLENGGLQWPCPTADHPGTTFLHGEKFARGRGHFVPLEYKPSAELPDDKYPLTLTTDRSIYHFHTSTMSRRVKGLEALDGEELLRIHPDDAARLEIADGDMLRVMSRRGKISVRAKLTDACPPGVVSLTFHFAEAPTNVLTHAALDPVAKIPETKVCAVRIEKVVEKEVVAG
jgi:formate dehydrogenase alpha subunit